jgi:short-chain dehydrogenase/reductase SDR
VLKKSRGIANGASIVAMSSISSIRAMKAKMAFCSAKAALDAAVKCLAVELGDKGIRINSVQKGGVDADFDKDHIQDVTAINENATEQKQILGLTRAIEVANTVAFLLSDAATTITGTSIVIDGGYTL